MRRRTRFIALCLAGTNLVATSHALAQVANQETPAQPPTSAAASDGKALDQASDTRDIVVTAQRREQRLQDVPVAVTITTGAALLENNIRDLADLSVRLPNVKIQSAVLSDSINIRGVGSGYNAGFEQSVATFLDGVYRGRSRAARASLFDVDRVEVLKGPQTTFFGANAIAGALNITSRKPSQTFEYNASGSYAPADGEYNAEVGVGGPLTDSLSARLATRFNGMDGYYYNDQLQEHGPHLRDWTGRLSLRWQPTSGLTSDLRIDGVHNRDKGTYNGELIGCPPAAEYGAARGVCLQYLNAYNGVTDNRFDYHAAGQESHSDYDMFETAWTNQLDIGDHTVTSTTSYFDHKVDILTQTMPLPIGGNGQNALQPFRMIENYNQFSQELRLQSPTSGRLSYIGGLYFQRGDLESRRFSTFYYASFGASAAPYYTATSPIARYGRLDQIDTTYSAFGSAAYDFTNWLTLNVGARYSIVRKKGARFLQLGVAGSDPGPETFVPGVEEAQVLVGRATGIVRGDYADKTRTDKAFMPSANLQFKITPTTNAYISFARGFKAGGFGDSDQIVRFDPEYVDAYEIGFKGSLFDRMISYNIAMFRSNYDDLQEASSIVQTNGSILQTIANVAQARSQGLEVGGTLRLSRMLSFNTDLAYLDSTYLNYRGAPCTILQSLTPNCTQDLSGKQRSFAPKYSGNLSADLTVPIESRNEVRFSPSLYFTSRYFQQPNGDPLTSQDGYIKYDARVSFGPKDRAWEFAVIGKNLSDKKTGSFRQPLGTSPGGYYILSERPRAVILQFSIKG